MFIDSVLLSLYFETPLHTGASGALGAIDLPVQRERTTQWPVIHATELRDALRRALGDEPAAKMFAAPEGESQVSVGEARMLLFPVRSSVAPFVWITCPAVLARLRRDIERTVGGPLPPVPTVSGEDVLVAAAWSHGSDVFAVEDVVLTPKQGLEPSALLQLLPASAAYDGFGREVEASLGVVSDDVFGFLVRTATEVSPVAGNGATPIYEELVPADSLFYAPVLAIGPAAKGKKRESALAGLDKQLATHLQVGGGGALGRGWARAQLLKAKGGTP